MNKMLSDSPELREYYKAQAHNRELPESERERYLSAIKKNEPDKLLKYFEE